MRLLFDVSAHGLGHLAQTAPVIDALAARLPRLQISVRSAIAHERLAQRIRAPFDHVAAARDFGFVMHNAVDIDLAASAARYRDFHADWPARVAAEADWLRRHGIDAVVCNAAYLPLAAAAEAGIPAAGMSSLNWADMVAAYFHGEPWAQVVHAQIQAAYDSAAAFLALSPGLPMTNMARRQSFPPVASPGIPNRQGVARALDMDESGRWLLLAMGGMDLPLPLADWPHRPGWTWLLPDQTAPARSDMRAFDSAALSFGTVLASADAVVTKPGYGTFVEAACGGVPILYLERPDWPESPHFADWLESRARAASVTRARLLSGDLGADFGSLWARPAPARPSANGAGEVADWLVANLVPRRGGRQNH